MDKERAIKLAQRYKAAVAERLPLKGCTTDFNLTTEHELMLRAV